MKPAAGTLPVVVLISGVGTNLQAVIDAGSDDGRFTVSAVISNRPDAPGLERAQSAGIATRTIDHTQYTDRESFDAVLGDIIELFNPRLIVLAGFMRILSAAFVERFNGRMINVHPSLLPAFQGLRTHQRVLEANVTTHGASVHFVTAQLDGGPVIAQARVPVRPDDDATTLGQRVLRAEHTLLPRVIGWFAEGRVRMRDGRVWLDDRELRAPVQC